MSLNQTHFLRIHIKGEIFIAGRTFQTYSIDSGIFWIFFTSRNGWEKYSALSLEHRHSSHALTLKVFYVVSELQHLPQMCKLLSVSVLLGNVVFKGCAPYEWVYGADHHPFMTIYTLWQIMPSSSDWEWFRKEILSWQRSRHRISLSSLSKPSEYWI